MFKKSSFREVSDLFTIYSVKYLCILRFVNCENSFIACTSDKGELPIISYLGHAYVRKFQFSEVNMTEKLNHR